MRDKSTKQEQGYKKKVLKKLWQWIDLNFHKVNDADKIKIAVALCAKDMPSKHEFENGLTLYVKNAEERAKECS